MSAPIDDGGPAFARSSGPPQKEINTAAHTGMSLRDWFAGQETLADFDQADAIISTALADKLAGPKPVGGWTQNPVAMLQWEATWRAKIKLIRADAMIAARKENA
jgi:hypothetical protein